MEEQDILDQIRHHDTRQSGFSQLVRKYQRPLYALIRRMVVDHNDADDVLQETFIKIWRGIGSFREDARLFTWIYRIATNECLQFLNKKKRRFFLPISDISGMLSDRVDTGTFSGDAIEEKLQKAIIKLPDKQRLVFNLKYYDELTFDQIAEITGTSVGALKASYHHAVKKIEDSVSND